HVNGASVLRMHADESTIVRCRLKGFEDAAIIQHKNSRIGHEELETSHSFPNEIIHLRELSAGNIGHNAVKRVIANCFVGGLAHPCVKSLPQGLAFVLNGEIDQRRRATEGSGSRSCLKIVGTGRASERHVEMRVHVNASRQHEFADRIQQADGVLSWEFFHDSSDLSVRNGNICQISIGGSNDSSVSNNRIEGHAGLPNGNKTEIMLHWRPLVLHNDLPGTPAVEKGTS